MSSDAAISYFGRTNARQPYRVFGIKQADRLSHMYVVGKTGTGKSTLLETLALQDIWQGRGVALLDPHGDLAARLARQASQIDPERVIYVNAADPAQPFGYNPLRHVRADRIPLAVSGLLEAFKRHWADAWGVRMEHVLRQSLFALIEHGGVTFLDIPRLLTDDRFRREVAATLTNAPVKDFWLKEYPEYSFRYRADAIAPIQNKVGAFLADPNLRRMVTEPERQLHFRRIMDRGQVLIVNLARGVIGEDSSSLLGSLLVTTIGLAAFSRAELPERQRRDFFLYIDEFQTYTTLSVASMISELRKYRVGLILANQNLDQLDHAIRSAILGNAGTLVSFRVGPQDAALLAREFAPQFDSLDLTNLPNHRIYVKLLIDGEPSRPFSANTLSPEIIVE
jgi:hypothetical protein